MVKARDSEDVEVRRCNILKNGAVVEVGRLGTVESLNGK